MPQIYSVYTECLYGAVVLSYRLRETCVSSVLFAKLAGPFHALCFYCVVYNPVCCFSLFQILKKACFIQQKSLNLL